MSEFSISQSGDIFNRIGAIGDSIMRSCRLFATAKNTLDNRLAAEGVVLNIFMAGDDAAFKVNLNTIISDNDLFHQLLHDHAVICVHDSTALDVFCEAVQP